MNHGERSKNHVNAQNVDAVLSALKGATVTRVSIECWSVRMLLGDAELIIEAEWELYNSAGEIVDTSLPLKSRRAFEIWKLTGETVVDTSLLHSMSTVLTINFSNNWKLILTSNDDGFEDWSLVAIDRAYLIICNGTV